MGSTSATTSSDLLSRHLATLAARGRRALVTYITAGHPSPDATVTLMRVLESSGADVIEVGLPFSDPMADGPVIQASSQSALSQGVTFDRTLELIGKAAVSIPVVLFSYLNPVLAAGTSALERAAAAGAHGLLITDLPVGADPALEQRFGAGPLAFVRLVAPTTPVERMREIAAHGRGFVYLISRLGVTGAREDLASDLPDVVARLRQVTSMPVCVGFGVSTPEQARSLGQLADGIVVGSAVVRAAQEGPVAVERLVRSLRGALDEA
ncbi:MAG: tryptophan synthase subunit alpha [Gemmatimonadaceae bacterium]